MSTGRRRRVALLAGFGLALGLAGCSSNSATQTSTSTRAVSTTASQTTVTSTSVAASTSSSTTSTSAPASSTTSGAVPICARLALRVSRGKVSVATNDVTLGVLVANTASRACSVEGVPSLKLVSAGGSLTPMFSTTGPSARSVIIAPGTTAGFVLGYTPAGGVACNTGAHVVGIQVSLPGVTGAAIPLDAGFFACPAGSPTIKVSAVLSIGEYDSVIG